MSWKNIKTFLIILFLGINIYLLFLTSNASRAKELTDHNIYETRTVLAKNHIAINTDIIPRYAVSYETVELSAYISNETAKNGDISICENIEFDNQTAITVIKSILKKHGINTKNIVIKSEGDIYYITENHGNMRLFNNKLTVTQKDGKTNINGTWFNHKSTDKSKSGEHSGIYATSALIAFISEYNGKETEITDITCGYYAFTDQSTSNAKSISAVPCYRLTDKKDNVYYYNVLDNSFIE